MIQTKFYLESPYLHLLNPDSLHREKLMTFPFVQVVNEFYEKMQESPEFDFKIMGLFLKSTARIHRKRVSNAVRLEKTKDTEYKKAKEREEVEYEEYLGKYIMKQEEPDFSEVDSEIFYEQLMVHLKSKNKPKVDDKGEFDTLEDIVEETEIEEKKPKRKRRIVIKEPAAFDAIIIDLERVEIDLLINQILSVIRDLDKQYLGDKEVQFDEVIQIWTVENDYERRKLEKVRALISLLYLIKEGFVEAWQDLETNEITISLTMRGKSETFGFKPIGRDEA